MSQPSQQVQKAPRTFWAVIAFYGLISFEFFYMASPIAIYFYSVYQPALDWINQFPFLVWLSGFFLPHIVIETKNPLINAHNIAGALLMLGGLLFFAIGAFQVYFNKLTRRGAVTGGLYTLIRHPQYSALILSGLGMLILWPRFISLALYVCTLFVYILLAWAEEKECEMRFGESYLDYKKRTAMFFPIPLPAFFKRPLFPQTGLPRFLSLTALFFIILGGSIGLGMAVKYVSIQNLYAIYTPGKAFIAAGATSQETLNDLFSLSQNDPQVQKIVNAADPAANWIIYTTPADWDIAEIPMQGNSRHHVPANFDPNRYKVVLTQSNVVSSTPLPGELILLNASNKKPVVEVWINLSTRQVERVFTPEQTMYQNIPVPVY